MINTDLVQASEKKLLGDVIDENLNFKSHVEFTAAKATRSLYKISVFAKEYSGAPTPSSYNPGHACGARGRGCTTMTHTNYVPAIQSMCTTTP